MAKICYVPKSFSAAHLDVIERADAICAGYAAQGFTLTLRQLYYQFVARGLLPNKDTEYKRLGAILNDARLAGLIDWSHMEDRTRNVRSVPHWSTPASIIGSAAASYRIDKWARQPAYVEVWIEKDALVGVIEGVCARNDVPHFSCRGYTSQSEVWGAAQRIIRATCAAGKEAIVLHLGDHDPSGIDMTRDIDDRLALFCERHGCPAPAIRRLALNKPQIDQYGPPPNPAKLTDSRATGYIARHGYESWELDALDPPVIEALIDGAIADERDDAVWAADVAREEAERAALKRLADRWADIRTVIEEGE